MIYRLSRKTLWSIVIAFFVEQVCVVPYVYAEVITGPATEHSAEQRWQGETVASLSQGGLHFQALSKYYSKKPEKFSLADKLAAARSAWALGLVKRVRTIWEEVLAIREFEGNDRYRLLLSHAILELQEGNFELARAVAESAARDLGASDLRAQLWLVIAESLKEQGVAAKAKDYYRNALEEGSGSVKEEASLLLGECQLKLGLQDDARYTLTSIPNSSKYTARALKRLVQIDFKQRDYDGVITWIEEGESSHAEEFDLPWLNFMHIASLVELGRLTVAEKQLRRFQLKHSDKNEWFLLAKAAFESKVVSNLYPAAAQNFEKLWHGKVRKNAK